jgi:magnesium-transporting ATPase (P-type)
LYTARFHRDNLGRRPAWPTAALGKSWLAALDDVFDCWNNAPLFQTGWFVESLLTQTLIIHIIRTPRIPFIESRASAALIATSIVICLVGAALPFTWAGAALGFVPPPPAYWPFVIAMLASYALLTHLVKAWFVRRWGCRPVGSTLAGWYEIRSMKKKRESIKKRIAEQRDSRCRPLSRMSVQS